MSAASYLYKDHPRTGGDNSTLPQGGVEGLAGQPIDGALWSLTKFQTGRGHHR